MLVGCGVGWAFVGCGAAGVAEWDGRLDEENPGRSVAESVSATPDASSGEMIVGQIILIVVPAPAMRN